MRIYFLVEGVSTESQVYPVWLSYLVPELKRIEYPDIETENSYFLIDGAGFPSIIYTHLPNSIKDVNDCGNYNHLVICLDADESTVADRTAEINDFLTSTGLPISATLNIIVQNRCFETWLLGNRTFIRANPTGAKLLEYKQHYDVRIENPELMPNHPDCNTTSQFHYRYLREAFKERGNNLSYGKNNPSRVLTESYLNQLQRRVEAAPTHLNSLQTFFNFCTQIRQHININAP